MEECPGPTHSCLPFLSNSPQCPACLIARPEWVLTTDHTLRAEKRPKTRSSESYLSFQKGLHIAYMLHLWMSKMGFKTLPFRSGKKSSINIQYLMEILGFLQKIHSIQESFLPSVSRAWK